MTSWLSRTWARLWLGTGDAELNAAARELLSFADLPAGCTIARTLVDVGAGNAVNELKLVWAEEGEAGASSAEDAGSSSDEAPLVLLHGYGASAAHWYRSIGPVARLRTRAASTVYALDWLGCGRASRPAWPVPSPTVARRALAANADPHGTEDAEAFFVDALDAWRVAKGLDQLCLVGHSLGGYLAVAYAERHPERVSRLILVSPVGVPHAPSEAAGSARFNRFVTSRPLWQRPLFRGARALFGRLWESGASPQQVMRFLGGWAGFKLVEGYAFRRFPTCSEEERAAIGNYMYHSSAAPGSGEYALAHILAPGAYAHAPLAERLPALAERAIPIDFIYGEDGKDWMSGMHAADLVESGALPPTTRVLRVEGAGHQLILDDPRGFAAAMESIRAPHPVRI
jgi:cardiolipin-specific phospholipase